jgi:acyl-CoA synthetase (AMP-forming)/AMP-acid ligase II
MTWVLETDGVAALLAARARRHGDRAFLVHARRDRSLSWAEVDEATLGWTSTLEAFDVPPGTKVGLALADSVTFAVTYLSVIAAGRWAVPIDPAGTDPAGSCLAVGARLLVADEPSPGAGAETLVLRSLGPRPADGRRGAGRGLLEELEGPPGVLLRSSGTTGQPKVVALDQRRLLHTARSVALHHRLVVALDQRRLLHTARSVALHHRLGEEDRVFSALPLFHINAEVVVLLAGLLSGGTLVLDDRFHARDCWSKVLAHRCTWVNAVPAVIARLADLGPPPPLALRFVRSASAPLTPELRRRFEALTGVPVVETYGMTEAGSQITASPLDGSGKPGSVGRPVGVELRVREDGREARAGAVGSIEIRGPGVITRYAAGGEGRIGVAGWLETGDLGRLDAEGDLFLCGRSDDVINRGGEKVYPREIEEVLLEDPAVTGAVVIAGCDDVFGEVPLAYLTVRGASGLDGGRHARTVALEALDRCAKALPRAKRPQRIGVLAELPRGATGKVIRRRIAPSAERLVVSVP